MLKKKAYIEVVFIKVEWNNGYDKGLIIWSSLDAPRRGPQTRIQVQVVFLGDDPRKHQKGSKVIKWRWDTQ